VVHGRPVSAADALGGEATVELVEGGHWPWHGRPALVERTGDFLRI
jgi:hypothetical protein